MTRRRRRVAPAVLAALSAASCAVSLTACGAGGPTRDTAAGAVAAPGSPSGAIVVLAAASLTGTFTELGRRFEAAHPGAHVTFGFGPSSGLATQITEGAPADVFAAASAATMRRVVDAGLASSARVFASNALEIAVPPGNPAKVDGLDDLAEPGIKVVLCQEQVPCGIAADAVLDRAGLQVTPVSREADVKAVLTKVALDEADAGLVYVTDVRAAGDDVRGIELPEKENTSTDYPIAVLARDGADAQQRATAEAFVDLVLSSTGRAVLADAGFAAP